MAQTAQEQTLLYQLMVHKKYRILRHILLLLIILLVTLNYAIPYEYPVVFSLPVFICFAAGLFLTYLIPTYVNIYYLIPRYMLTGKYPVYFFYLSVWIVFNLLAQYILEKMSYQVMGMPVLNPTYNENNHYIFILDVLGGFFLNIIAFTGCSMTLLLRHWITNIQREGQLESNHIKTEVEHLKQQVNPGFLFNTLHRIAEIGETDSTKASAALMRFSKLLRYQLYDSNRNEVFLASEIQFINDYLTLEQLYYQSLRFRINTEGNLSYILVPPMLFIPFILQFMDGIRCPDTHANLCLTFSVKEDMQNQLIFTCVGDMPVNTQSEQLNGVRKRLNLHFNNRYQLQLMPAPFIIPEGHKIYLSLELDNPQ